MALQEQLADSQAKLGLSEVSLAASMAEVATQRDNYLTLAERNANLEGLHQQISDLQAELKHAQVTLQMLA